ncbi:hypothetical protein [Schlesneria sp. DSM 10557]|uniref:hypothetical protein n=1 Tax=Schlesneria sp. DSM 10557 TaxID=3044399 RepID=UPI00359FD391
MASRLITKIKENEGLAHQRTELGGSVAEGMAGPPTDRQIDHAFQGARVQCGRKALTMSRCSGAALPVRR